MITIISEVRLANGHIWGKVFFVIPVIKLEEKNEFWRENVKKENILLPISIIILGGCIVLSAWIITDGIVNEHLEQPLISTQTKALMTSDEAAQYMGISLNDFDLLIKSQIEQKAGVQSYDTYRFIPLIHIGNQIYFNETEINKWIEYNMLNK